MADHHHHGSEYRQYLPDLSQPRFTTMAKQDPWVYAKEFKEKGNPPWLHALYLHWLELLKEPFKGVTNDGVVRPGLFPVQDEGIPIDTIVATTQHAMSLLTAEQLAKLSYHIDSPEWRTWSNPEFLLSDKGVRLDNVTPQVRDSILAILRETLSPEGYAKAVGAMRINGFLGDLVRSPAVMNEYSYNFVLFGEPSNTRPWGISFYGHHLCLNIFFYRTQLVVSPWFTGAEPNEIDAGPYEGTRILQVEEQLGLKLMQSLPSEQQAKAQIYKQMVDPAMPKGRWNHDDQRHLCGAYRDNRVVPYEGILVSSMTQDQQSLVRGILEQYLLYLPQRAREIRLKHIESRFDETYFCWIGGFTDTDPFYYRIQSPLVLIEFDHHSGVFLNNTHPAKFHIHALLRTPNAGDYGMALRPQVEGIKQEFVWSPNE
ncbi:hypothetical protein HRR83_001361 [Exophiala dermatitidis]|uniref:DUF3500 domain-containing protein n=2 Tax=Exophiala dermatitidis TaxID=5970 RepID=H6C6L8_EXODN|nr:uncharacterized protein HMPREF1120_07355 [Exophiala dermatitidis NIH/UT8656]KAJ4522862.1 hypothetical protein HRR75_001256 [Exophiala dermatitidis]EHY59364.1 hypothetical protein HMPREF1120_07355 [Exophiala dermatitidis NIH/UT8656]KAJ4526172.1 hypothetical protein HRR74_001365 [Exophiala dermatitidis]KAJ4526884.1 hypothetical protein HRR73_001681 [Exophiala dermatitidis]KAJ4532595.1 hypothetical protein HRR76_007583 [Exophiala dermatitidis]